MPQITLLYASLLTLLYVPLSMNVIRGRFKANVALGDGNDKYLLRMIRMHGNASEYIPIGLLMIALNEMNGAPAMVIHIFGATFLLARILHPLGLWLKTGPSKPRFFGTVLTFLVLLANAATGIILFF